IGRFGVRLDELAEFARGLGRLQSVKLDGVMTHFAAADSATTDYTERQIALYEEAVEILRGLGFDPSWRHLANSAGIHAYPQSHGNLARVGAAMYGLTRDALSPNLEPFGAGAVLSLPSRGRIVKT